jgi:choline dehydrogenase
MAPPSTLLRLFALLVIGTCAALATPCASNNTYDYVVVGSGPGGGTLSSMLAQKGYSVFLIEAGDDESASPDTVVPELAFAEPADNNLHWDFFVRHYSDLNRTLAHHYLTWRLTDGTYWVGQNPPAGATLLGVYYPRGASLGGSSIINYLVSILPPDSDWQNIVNMTGDDSWR